MLNNSSYEITTLNPRMYVCISRLMSYENFIDVLILQGSKLGIQFGISETDRFLTKKNLIERQSCYINYLNYSFNLITEKNELPFIYFEGFNNAAYIRNQDDIYLLKYEVFIPLMLKLVNLFPVNIFEFCSKNGFLNSEINENNTDVLARLYYPPRYEFIIDIIRSNIKRNRFKILNKIVDRYNPFSATINLNILNFNVAVDIDGSHAFLRPIPPYKTKSFDSKNFIDVEFYVCALVNILDGIPICEMRFVPNHKLVN